MKLGKPSVAIGLTFRRPRVIVDANNARLAHDSERDDVSVIDWQA